MTTQTPIEPRRPTGPAAPPQGPKIHHVEVYWHAVTYKTVAIVPGAVIRDHHRGHVRGDAGLDEIVTKKVNNALGNR